MDDKNFESLHSAYLHSKDTLEGFNWVVIVSSETKSIELFDRFKNGKIKRSSSVSIAYEEFTTKVLYNLKSNEVKELKEVKQRPWTIRAKSMTTTTFSNLDSAMEKFLEYSEILSPL